MTSTKSKTKGPAARTSRKPAAGAVPHLSVGERVARGKAARAEVPRSSHALFEPSRERSRYAFCFTISMPSSIVSG